MRNQFFILEVEKQTPVESVEVNDGYESGFEPRSVLMLKAPEIFSYDSFAAMLQGEAALHRFKKGDLVAVKLRFQAAKKNHEYYTQVVIEDIKLVKNTKPIYV